MSYDYFMKVEPSEYLGPIRLEEDAIFDRRVKVRTAKIGMVRNATEKNRKEVKVFLEPFPHVRIDKAKDLQGWYKGKNESNAVRPRPCYTEALLTEPYGGFCPVGCAHCYINSGIRGYRGTGLVTVPLNYGEQIRKQLSRLCKGSAGYLTSFHDPFNILEKTYHNSQEAAKAFVDVGLPIFFLSRLKFPLWAIRLLQKNRHSYAQKSINTSCSATWRKLSPGALPLAKQFAEIQKLKAAGIYVSVQVNPILPGITSNLEIKELFKMLGEVGADHVIVKFAEAGYSWASAMTEKMVKLFGEKGKKFEELFSQNIGGNRTVDEDYRMASHKKYGKWAKQYGLTYSVCYEYRYERDERGNIISKTGISIGPEVTTSAQCHGQRVPMYSRKTVDSKFKAVKKCPKTGCLYCADDNEGEPKCGDVLLGEAPALRLRDLRTSVGANK